MTLLYINILFIFPLFISSICLKFRDVELFVINYYRYNIRLYNRINQV